MAFFNVSHFATAASGSRRTVGLNLAMTPTWTGIHTFALSTTGAGPGVSITPTLNGPTESPVGLNVSPTFAASASHSIAIGMTFRPVLSPPVGVTVGLALGCYYQFIYSNVAGAVTTGYGAYVATPTIQGSLKPTSHYGLFFENQGSAGMTNAIGVHIAAQTSATNNYDLSFGTVDLTTTSIVVYGRIPILYNGLKKYILVCNA